MSTASTILRLNDLPATRISALKRKAKGLGLTAEGYVKQLIEDDLELDRQASNTSLNDLASPFRKALGSASDQELDQLVNTARRRPRASHKKQ